MANRLQYEDSPYLQQHKDNPVDWYPWCDEAFERAKKEHKAIFISIGYSSCHWCHVMEEEVFENEEIAAFLNEHLISIKVDREERPDIDKYYQEVHLLLNRRAGGWPTSIICTPENDPFFAGTYLPPYQRDHLMGFHELIQIVATKIRENDQKLFETAEEIQRFMQPDARPTEATRLNETVAEKFVTQAGHNYETQFGGFSDQPKFPHSSTLTTLLNIAIINDDANAASMVKHTLGMMQRGGMYDLIDGGFCRYSVDTAWLVPHFEKMTYDNGLLCELYTRAGHYFDDASLIRTAKEIADFMLSTMQEENLFYSASDADSEGEEGKYFLFSMEEAVAALQADGHDMHAIDEILATLHITPEGNFEGQNIIWIEGERPTWFEAVRSTLKAIRTPRPYPFIDRKVQVSWNAMMIKALFRLGRSEQHYLDAAVRAMSALLTTLYIDHTLYHSTLIHKQPKVKAFLEDYAYLGTALIEAYESTLDESYLILAQQMANSALSEFYDEGRWYFSKGEFVTEAEITDSTYPGSVGVIVDLLLSLGTLTEEKYRRFAFKSIEYYSLKIGKTPVRFPYLFNQVFRYLKEDRVIKASSALLKANMAKLTTLSYPYTLFKPDTYEGFMVCGVQSCFANTADVNALEEAINRSI